jgi:polysaccharide deacetylase 2 family uncharacterized protein YibQ
MAKKQTSKKTRPKGRKKQKKAGRVWPWWLILLCAGVLVGGLVLLARFSETPPLPVVPAQQVKDPVVSVDPLPAIQTEVEAFLGSVPLSSDRVERELKSTPVRYTAHGQPPEEALLDGLRQRLAKISNDIVLNSSQDGLVVVKRSGEALLTIFFVPELVPVVNGPQVAIIMDDLGRGLYPAQVLIGLQQQVTMAILPGETEARQVAEMGYAAGREIMVHVPMEPQGFPAVNPGDDALFVRYDAAEINTRLNALLKKVPHAIGANNHMGSRFTEDYRAMASVMETMSEMNMFFVDSVTTGRSVVAETAAESAVMTARRDVFLDNVADVDLIIREIQRLADKARQKGTAVGICHPYPETLEALRRELPRQADAGIRFVKMSSLVRRGKD